MASPGAFAVENMVDEAEPLLLPYLPTKAFQN